MHNNYIILLVLLFALVEICNGDDTVITDYGTMKELYDEILRSHNKYIEPPLTGVVRITITLDALLNLDEVEEKLSTVMSFKIRWQDKSMSWNATTYPLKHIAFGDDVVWKPIMELGNPHNSQASISQQSTRMVYYWPEGHALWWTTKSQETRCNIDTTYFPYDKQICEIRMKFPSHNFRTIFEDTASHLNIKENSNWKISKYQIWREMTFGTMELVFRYHFDRKPSAAFINLILPVFILVSLTPLVFLLPKGAGDRLGLSLTTLLAVSVYMTIINDSLPKASDPIPIITIILFLWYVSNTCVVVLTLINARICRISDKRTVPLVLRRLVKLTRKCCCQANLYADTVDTSLVKRDEENDPEKGLICDSDHGANSKQLESEEKHPDVVENAICWRHVSSALDRWFIVGIYVLKVILVIAIVFVFKYGPNKTDEVTSDNQIYWEYNSTLVN